MLPLVLCAAVAAAGAPPGMVETTLPNGLEVTIVPDATMPVVATQVWYHVGAANEDAGSRGLAHLFEHLMFGATGRYASGDFAKLVTRAGGYENAFTSPDETVYVSEVPAETAPEVLRREADRMRGLAITESNLDNEKKIVTEELRLRTENDPTSRLLVRAQQALLGDHPYALDASGSKADVARASVASCRAFYDAYYHPGNAHLVVVGPVDPAATMEVVRASFGPIPAGGRTPADVPPLYGRLFPSGLTFREDIPPVEVALVGAPLPPADAEDAAAVEVLQALLAFRSVDPLHEILVTRRKKALEAGIQTLDLRRGGGIVFYSASLPYRRETTAMRELDRAIDELDRLEWLTEASLAAAKRSVLLRDLRGRSFAASMASSVGRARWWLGSSARAFDDVERIDAVTREQVAAAWRTYVRDAAPIRVYVKPERVPLLIRMFGWLYPLFS
ncbi:MAG TPA: pitrilysin family protein [Candidatus Polarisedimenticolaceae bacterium]|nr:pitrilysin family protein [Candidatus Polarisedimenticolaceae bacterium]